jgi:mannosyl-oligosaccharide alpha-1,2-mannosidase
VEAFFVLFRVTGDAKYREYGWEVFSAFETFTKVSLCRAAPFPHCL